MKSIVAPFFVSSAALACASSLVVGVAPSVAQSWNGKGADPLLPAAPSPPGLPDLRPVAVTRRRAGGRCGRRRGRLFL